LSKIQSEELQPPPLILEENSEGVTETSKFKPSEHYHPTKGSEFVYLVCLYLQSPHTLQHLLGVTDSLSIILKIVQCSVQHLESLKKYISIGVQQKISLADMREAPNYDQVAQANEIYLSWCLEGFHHFVWVIGISLTVFLTCFRFLSPYTASALLNLQIREVLFSLFGNVAGDSRIKNRKTNTIGTGTMTTATTTPTTRFMDEKLLLANVAVARKTREELLQQGILLIIKGIFPFGTADHDTRPPSIGPQFCKRACTRWLTLPSIRKTRDRSHWFF
jgi:hypothetical protein